MGELANIEGSELAALMHGKDGAPSMPKPYERDIFLFDTYIAGTSHVAKIEELEPFIKEGDRLTFYREPKNAFDEYAIRVQNADGEKLGYVPKKDNVVFSRLMDAGKILFGKVSSKEYIGTWLKIDIRIFLHE